MRIYELLLVNKHNTGFVPTIRRYFVAIPSYAVANQFTLDEERRSGYDVYLKPIGDEHLKLELFTRLDVDTPDEQVSVSVYKQKEEASGASRHH